MTWAKSGIMIAFAAVFSAQGATLLSNPVGTVYRTQRLNARISRLSTLAAFIQLRFNRSPVVCGV